MKTAFHVSHRARSKFVRRGLRNYFEYRDLGIKRATRGKVVAHVIRARPGKAPHGDWHLHDCDVQFVYVLKGWVLFEYEGVGRVKMKAGTCFYQPPRIRHRVLIVEQMAWLGLEICDRAYVLENGMIALSGTSAEVASNPRVIEAYLGTAR